MPKAHIGNLQGKRSTVMYELNHLTRHAAVLGSTGSGKTVMCKVLVEEALKKGIPVIAIDPKGDIAGLAITDKKFDFRPFISSKTQAEKLASEYKSHVSDAKSVQLLTKVKTRVYTPKSQVGIALSLLPDLSAPKNFKKQTEFDPTLVANFVEPVSESVLQLAGVKGAKKETMQSFISAILIHHWNEQKDLTIKTLIDHVLEPPFEKMGSLSVDDVIKANDRKKLASSINLILTSPAKKAWSQGEELDIPFMLRKNSLSVFDLRFTGTIEEKQFVVEQILQELYKYLLQKGGTTNLKAILYVDELLGLLPPPPASPPSKKLLELLIRQARAFGLGIILATQNPGDIDYRIFSNVGSRFIGKLRTTKDMEKIAGAMDLVPSQIKSDIAGLKTGDFIYHNANENSKKLIHARWLNSYHGGPLEQKHIEWINNPVTKPKVSGSLKISNVKKETVSKTASRKKKGSTASATRILRSIEREIDSKKKKKKTSKLSSSNETKGLATKTKKALTALTKQVKKYADKTYLKVAASQSQSFTPHLKIVVETKPYKEIAFALQGPFVFDLTTKAMPLGNYLKGVTFRELLYYDIEVEEHKNNIAAVFRYALSEAKRDLRTELYESTLTKFVDVDRDVVENKNHEYMRHMIVPKQRQLEARRDKEIAALEKKISANTVKTRKFSAKIAAQKSVRIVKRIFSKNKLSTSTKELQHWKKRATELKKENARYSEKIKKIRSTYRERIITLKDKAFEQAHRRVKKKVYRPQKKDITVHATILLVPKRKTKL